MLGEGKDLTEALRRLEIEESTWSWPRSQYGGIDPNRAVSGRDGRVSPDRTRQDPLNSRAPRGFHNTSYRS